MSKLSKQNKDSQEARKVMDQLGPGFSKINRALLRQEYFEERVSAISQRYDGSPESLMLAIETLLRVCQFINKNAEPIYDEFRKAVEKYRLAEVVELGEAFGLMRPKNWNQHAAKFRIQEMAAIESRIDEIRNLVEYGKKIGIESACRIVGDEYNKSWGKIRNDYYSYKKEMKPLREENFERLKLRYEKSHLYSIQDPKIPYEEWLKTDEAISPGPFSLDEYKKWAEHL